MLDGAEKLKVHMLIQNIPFRPWFLILLTVFSLTMFESAWAENDSTQELKEQQLKLRELLDRIGEARDQRSQQHATLRKLEKQMSCNWKLIQDYETCEKENKENLEKHLNCKHQAKIKAGECLTSSTE